MKKITQIAASAALIALFLVNVLPAGSIAVAATAKPTVAAKTATVAKKKPAVVTAPPFSRSAWIPFWNKTLGSAEITPQLTPLTSISPFSYEVLEGGIVYDASMRIDQEPWLTLFAKAKAAKTKIYPTIAWFNGEQMDSTLKDPDARKAHEDMIMEVIVSSSTFSGVDIDYESKFAETAPYFSAFIKELGTKVHAAPGGKKLICTIEPRMPLEARFTTVTDKERNDVAFANDYTVLNKYCDQVRIMAYDQGTIDVQLVASKGTSQLYSPVADPDWVAKIVALAAKDIAPSKIVLGIPTYGYMWGLTMGTNGQWQYDRLRAINYDEAMALAQTVGATPKRNNAGELSYSYVATTTTDGTFTPITPQLRFVDFTDGPAVADKVALAHKMKIGGVVLFKADGEGDPTQWAALRQ